MARNSFAAFAACAVLVAAASARAEEPAPDADFKPETSAVHGQATFVDQGHTAFRSPYQGPNSLSPAANGRETFDATLYLGVRPWKGGEIWINGEIDQGFGLNNTLGVAGFPSGEAYKIGKRTPYPKLPRLFLRQTFDLGGESQKVDADLNQLAMRQTADRVVLTLGKFSVADVFDANAYAHDPRHDFLNWALIDAGTFDYAANAWGYTYGASAELYRGRFALRLGVFDLSKVPNSVQLDTTFQQFQLIAEAEERHELNGQPGKLRVTVFDTRGRMGGYGDAARLAMARGGAPDVGAVRAYGGRTGVSLDLEQQLSKNLGMFARAGVTNGKIEPYEFADIDRTVSAGLSLKGARWGRGDDTFALAGVVNDISAAHRAYLAAGGLGILIGDGALPHAGREQILETYYDIAAAKHLHVSFDFQYVINPAYNRDRGPVSIGAIRLHSQF